jgi:hypothetical protein
MWVLFVWRKPGHLVTPIAFWGDSWPILERTILSLLVSDISFSLKASYWGSKEANRRREGPRRHRGVFTDYLDTNRRHSSVLQAPPVTSRDGSVFFRQQQQNLPQRDGSTFIAREAKWLPFPPSWVGDLQVPSHLHSHPLPPLTSRGRATGMPREHLHQGKLRY